MRFAEAYQEGHIDPIHLVVAVINNIAASRRTRLEGLELVKHQEIYGRWVLDFPGKDVPTIPYSVLEDGWDQALNMGVLRRKHPDTADLTRASIVIVEAKAGDVFRMAQLLSARRGRVWVKKIKPLLEFARRYWPISLAIGGAIVTAIVWLAQHLP